MNGHFSAVGEKPGAGSYEHGVQVIDEDKEFNDNLNEYLQLTSVAESGFNYHLISVFGSQSTGKSTLLNNLFGTDFSVMSETERRQTTKGIWMSKNKREESAGTKMADNILVMDVEGTDGRERGEDQDFERKSALFALATSEVLIINIWEHQVGLYQGANMGLLKTVFEVNLQLFLKDKHRKRQELEGKIDARLKALYQGQLAAAHKAGVAAFGEAVANKVKAGQKAGGAYEFAEIVANEKRKTLDIFGVETQSLFIEGVAWTNFESQLTLFEKELDEESAKLRKEEMRRLATRVERWVKSRLNDAIGLEFNKLGSGRGGSGAPETGEKPPTEKDLWDRVWNVFTGIVKEAESRFAERAKSFDATNEEVEIGTWRLRRKSWTALRERIEDEVMEGNILLKLRENFEDKFRYDEAGVPRIWRPTDDIEGIYTKARESTLTLVPLLSKFRLSETNSLPDLPGFVGPQPSGVEASDEEDLAPIGGIDEEDGKSLEEEMTVLSEGKRQDLVVRFKKTADGVYVEAKRGAIGGVAQIPWYFYGLLLALGWNEIFMVLRNPFLCLLILVLAGGTYVAYTLNLLGPMMSMGNAAATQGVEIAKQQLRDFITNSDTARQAVGMPARNDTDNISMDTLDSRGRRVNNNSSQRDDDIDDI
ncbi:Dynamin-like GTPase that mediates homotypic ER fusion [Fusarium falciforme]|nr:Dynamin-like GTPase that mediates homotypic ER fusion [Fusarium falciforme]